MRVAKFVAIVLLCLSSVNAPFRAQQAPTTATHLPARNNNPLSEIQKRGGDPARPGDVKIEFYGHDAFKITSPDGVSVLTDPWRNDSTGAFPKWFLRNFPAVSVAVVVSTHAHFDHDAVDRPHAVVVLERLVGEFKLGDVAITGLADKHASGSEPSETALDNAIQIIETGGLRIAVWGDNRATPDVAWDRYLKNVDVLVLPVEAVLDRAETEAVVGRYEPKAIIPSHYFVRGLTTKASGVESVDGWVSDQEKNRHADVRRLDGAELTLNAAALKDSHRRIYFFGDHAALK